LSPEQAESIDAFYRDVETRMLNFYDPAKLNARRIHEQESQA
jgi:hypothetical protein